MKFNKDSEKGKKYLENLQAYLNSLGDQEKGLRQLCNEYQDLKEQTEYVNLLSLLKKYEEQKKEVSSFFDNASKGEEVENSLIEKIAKKNEDMIEDISSQHGVFNKYIKENEGKTNAKVKFAYFAASILNSMSGSLKKGKFLTEVPDLIEEKKEVKEEKKTTDFRESYINEFERLAKELKNTDIWYSKGSKSYQALRGSIDGYLKELKSASSENFPEVFNSVMERFNQKADAYREEHDNGKKLATRQMKRLKIMNRFKELGDAIKNADIDPAKDYKRKIAEKFVHAKAITALNVTIQ